MTHTTHTQNKKLEALKKLILEEGGATLTSNLQKTLLNNGFMVSLAGSESKIKVDDLSIELLNSYKKLAKKNGAFIGFWMDCGILYVDCSINVLALEEAEKIGRSNDQLAIYDLQNQTTIYL